MLYMRTPSTIASITNHLLFDHGLGDAFELGVYDLDLCEKDWAQFCWEILGIEPYVEYARDWHREDHSFARMALADAEGEWSYMTNAGIIHRHKGMKNSQGEKI